MTKIPNKLVIFGAVAAAALAVPGVLGPLMFEEAYATTRGERNQGAAAFQNAEGLINAQVAVPANVNVDDVNVAVAACVLSQTDDEEQCTVDQE
jgi:hypothetical protein